MVQDKKLPLKNLKDCDAWLEKAINETGDTAVSIARANARIAAVKGKINTFRLQLDYAKLVKGGTKIRDLSEIIEIEYQPTKIQ